MGNPRWLQQRLGQLNDVLHHMLTHYGHAGLDKIRNHQQGLLMLQQGLVMLQH